MKKLWKHYPKQNEDIFIDECGIENFFGTQTYSYNVLSNFVLHYVKSGCGYLVVNNQSYRINSGEGFLLRKGDYVIYYADKDVPWSNYWIGIDGEVFNSAIKQTSLNSSQPVKYDNNLLTDKIVEFCLEEKNKSRNLTNDYYWFKSKAYEFLYYIMQDFPKNKIYTDAVLKSENTYAGYALELMKKHYDNISINEIADIIGISRSYLYKQCVGEFNISPKQMLNDIRFEAALEMLYNLDLSISEIGKKVGFNNISDFSKSFKEKFGISPSTYRNRILKKSTFS